MTRNVPTFESRLAELGQARAQGIVGRGHAVRPLPWEAAKQSSFRRAAWGIAAAACVTFVLVGAWRIESAWTPETPVAVHNMAIASRDVTALSKTGAPATLAASPKVVLDGDYNGDGRVDGEDIQFYLNQKATKPEGEVENASDFARRLLGS